MSLVNRAEGRRAATPAFGTSLSFAKSLARSMDTEDATVHQIAVSLPVVSLQGGIADGAAAKAAAAAGTHRRCAHGAQVFVRARRILSNTGQQALRTGWKEEQEHGVQVLESTYSPPCSKSAKCGTPAARVLCVSSRALP